MCKKKKKGQEYTKVDGTKGIHDGRVKSKYVQQWHEEYMIKPTLEGLG